VPSNKSKSASKRKKKTTWKNERKALKGKSFETQSDPELDEEPHLKPSQCTLLGPVSEAEAELGELFHRIQHN